MKKHNNLAENYDQHAFIQFEVGKRLLERLSLMASFSPKVILDVGAGTGFLTRKLQAHYPKSTLMGLDIANEMISFAKKEKQSWRPWRSQPHYIQGAMEKLPFKNQSIDLIFSNFTLPWANDLSVVLKECKRVLSRDGILLFSTLGPNTLMDLNISLPKFLDMHDVGDALLNAQFIDPVVDMEMITVKYSKVEELLNDLKETGMTNLDLHSIALLPATYEIIYGYACQQNTSTHRQDDDGVVRIPADLIPRIPKS